MAAKDRITLFLSGNAKGIINWSQWWCNILWSKKLQKNTSFYLLSFIPMQREG